MGDTLAPGTPSSVQIKLLSWAASKADVPVDYHIHTAHTDGTANVQQMAKAAVSNGIVEVLFSEHARHTSTYFTSFVSEVRALQCSALKAYVGVETKILDLNGRLDCSPQIASMCDAIIGSVHSPPPNGYGEVRSWSQHDVKSALKTEFQLALAIVKKSRAHILGHPMGMVITQFNLRPLEHLYRLACACRDFDKAFELNIRYCPSPQEWVDIVRQANCKVSFGSDAHATAEVGNSWYMFMNRKV